MVTPIFALMLLALLGVALVILAVIDWRSFTISNRANLAIAATAPLFWLASGLGLRDIGFQLLVAAAVFLVCLLLFRLGQMGGGDVKLATALALWLRPAETMEMIVIMAVAGGILTLALLIRHRAAKKPGNPKIPYGVAIAAGALWIIAQRFLNHFGG